MKSNDRRRTEEGKEGKRQTVFTFNMLPILPTPFEREVIGKEGNIPRMRCEGWNEGRMRAKEGKHKGTVQLQSYENK